MEKASEPDKQDAQNTAPPLTARTRQSFAPHPQLGTRAQSGHLAQLSSLVNQSTRVQAQCKLAADLQSSYPVKAQQATAAEINAGSTSPAQLRQVDTRYGAATAQLEAAPNRTGLPDQLKSGVENLSGLALDDVKVHYNSAKPAQLNALAYAQGTDIHVAPGEEQHLPHEAWHIVQQKQGRVKATRQMKTGTPVNEDPALEQEADAAASTISHVAHELAAPAHLLADEGDSEPAFAPWPAQLKKRKLQPSQRKVGHSGASDVVQKFDGPTFTQVAIAIGILAARALWRNWPAGRSVRDVFTLIYHAGRGTLSFAYMAGWNSVSVIALATAYGLNANGLTAAQWVTIAGRLPANSDADATSFAQTAGWNFAAIDQLTQNFIGGANGLTVQNWITIAGRLPANSDVDTTSLARIAGWNFAAIDQLTQNFAGGANGLTVQNWVTIAGRLPANSDADATSFAQTAGWNFAAIDQLTQNFVGGANGLTVPQWVGIAGILPANSDVDATAFARIAGWSHAGIVALIGDFNVQPHGKTAAQWAAMAAVVTEPARPVVAVLAPHAIRPIGDQQRAAHIYTASGNQIAHVQAWIAGGWRGPAAAMLPAPGVLAGAATPPALDGVLGAGAHVAIRTLINANARPYVVNPFVVNHARTLIAAGAAQADALTLVTDFTTNIATAAGFDTAVDVARQMLISHVPVAEVRAFINNHAAQALGAAFQPAITDLITRTEVTGARLAAVLGILTPLGNPGMINFLNARFPATPGLTLRRIRLRLENFTQPVAALGQNVAIGNVGAQFNPIDQSLNARVLAGTMNANGRTWIQQAFRLLRGATSAGMMAFLGDGRVNGTFAQAAANNAAFWLVRFAQYHREAAPPVFANMNVVVAAGGAPQTVVIDNWIIDHVLRRHTYEHYQLQPNIINRPGGVPSTIITPPTTAGGIAASIQAILGNGAVAAAFPWAGGQINVGAVTLRIAPIPGGGGNYSITQYYYGVAFGLGQVVPQAALHAIAQHFPYLVY